MAPQDSLAPVMMADLATCDLQLRQDSLDDNIEVMQAFVSRLISDESLSGCRPSRVKEGVSEPHLPYATGVTAAGSPCTDFVVSSTQAETPNYEGGSVPDRSVLEEMVRLCLADLQARPGGQRRRNELGIMLRERLGADVYRKGYVNHAVGELARRGIGQLDEQGTFFTLHPAYRVDVVGVTRQGGAVPHGPPHWLPSSCASRGAAGQRGDGCRGARSAVLLIDGGYYETLQWHLLQGLGTHAVDMRLLLQELERTLGVRFARRLYVQGTPDGQHGPFHKMLSQPPLSFKTEIHRLKCPQGRAQQGLEQAVDVALASHILDQAYAPHADILVVITGEADLVPAFRMARMRSRTNVARGEKGAEVYALGGQRMAQELLAYVPRSSDNGAPLFVEGIMRSAIVRRDQLSRPMPGVTVTSSPTLAAHPHQQFRTSTSPVLAALHSHDHHRAHSSEHDMCSQATDSSRGSDSDSLDGTTGSCSVSSRPRRWCNFGDRCKYAEDVQGNLQHFRRFAHVCPLDRQCPVVRDFPVIPDTEDARAHMALFKHSCPNGLGCPQFASPELHRRHVETFTHKAALLLKGEREKGMGMGMYTHAGAHQQPAAGVPISCAAVNSRGMIGASSSRAMSPPMTKRVWNNGAVMMHHPARPAAPVPPMHPSMGAYNQGVSKPWVPAWEAFPHADPAMEDEYVMMYSNANRALWSGRASGY